MKTKIFAFVMLAFAFTVSASATKIPKMNIIALDDAKALIAAITDPNESTKISIMDENGIIVYYKESKASSEIKSLFDLSELGNGNYTVKVKTGNNSANGELEVSDGNVQVKSIKTEIGPYFSFDGRLLKLSYLNYNQNDLSLQVYKGSRLVFEHNMSDDFNIQRGFDATLLKKGKYEAVLSGSGEVFSYTFIR